MHLIRFMFDRKNTFIKNGFTLVELLLYAAVVSTAVLALSALLLINLQAQIKNQTIAEVNQQGTQVMQIITQAIRNSEGITSPVAGASSSSLSLDVVLGASDPTVFDLSSGTVRITEGAESAIPLTNSSVAVSALNFQNLSRSGTFGTVRVQFTITHVNPEGRNEYDYSRDFVGSATVRQ